MNKIFSIPYGFSVKPLINAPLDPTPEGFNFDILAPENINSKYEWGQLKSDHDLEKIPPIGVCIEKRYLEDINIFIAAINQESLKDKSKKFFISTDCEKSLHKILDALMHHRNPPRNPHIYFGTSRAIPNSFYRGLSFKDEYIADVNLLGFCSKIITTPRNLKSLLVNRFSGVQLETPDPEKIFLFRIPEPQYKTK